MTERSWKRWVPGFFAAAVLASLVSTGCTVLTPGNAPTQVSGTQSATTGPDTRDLFPDKAYPGYAHGYSVEYLGTSKVVHIHDPWGRATGNHTYLLVQRGETVPEGYPDARVFFIPIESAITLTVLHASYLAELDETPAIRGHNGIDFIINGEFQERARQGKIIEVGSGTLSMNTIFQTEKMIELEPGIIFCEATGNSESDSQKKLEEAGLKPAITAEWMEDHPLGRAEWIKYYALFFNREREANEIFERIEANYTSIREKTKHVSNRPTLFSGLEFQGTWYAPGGGSYVAQLFRDAGGDYLLANDTSSGDNPLDFEVVYERAHNAEFYINVGYVGGVEDILARDSRYSKFAAVNTGAVYHYDARMNEYGALDYWQSGVVHPDTILADLVKILHPDLVPDHELYYYRHVGAGTPDDLP